MAWEAWDVGGPTYPPVVPHEAVEKTCAESLALESKRALSESACHAVTSGSIPRKRAIKSFESLLTPTRTGNFCLSAVSHLR